MASKFFKILGVLLFIVALYLSTVHNVKVEIASLKGDPVFTHIVFQLKFMAPDGQYYEQLWVGSREDAQTISDQRVFCVAAFAGNIVYKHWPIKPEDPC